MLRPLLAEWFADIDGIQIKPHDASTGLSDALVWRVSLGGKTFCLKRWPREHPTPDELTSVHGLLQHVARSGFQFVPTPVVTRRGQSFLRRDDHLWELTPWLPGKPYDRNQPSLEKRLTAMRCLAQFHRTASLYETPTVVVAPGLLTRREILRGLRGDLVQLRIAVGAKPASELRAVAEEMFVQIERALPTVLGELEQVADVVINLERDEDQYGIINCKFKKNRNGIIGKAPLEFIPEFTKFNPVS
jgi:Ser/Thr protein kinase RdoA (MazF antagonist)